MYNSLVYPLLIYCITAWGSTANTHLNTLIILQKGTIRRIFNVDRSFCNAPLFKNLDVLLVRDIFRSMCLNTVYMSVNSNRSTKHVQKIHGSLQ